MANTIKIKAGSGTPTTSNIVDRELAFDRSANKLYINDNGSIVDLSGEVGDITAVTAGTGLDGGGSSGDVSLSVDVSDFMSNGSNDRILTATGTDAMNAEANLTFDGSHLRLPNSSSVIMGASDAFVINHNGSHNYIQNTKSDADVYFTVNDGGSTINALIIDSSEVANIVLPNDNQRLLIGAGNDLQLLHNGTNSYIANYVGDLIIENHEADKDIILYNDDGSGGTTPYITLDGSTVKTDFKKPISVEDSAFFADNSVLYIGTGNDLRFSHNGSNSFIQQYGTGDLYIDQTIDDKDIIFRCDDGSGGVTPYITLDGSDKDIDIAVPTNIDGVVTITEGSGTNTVLNLNGAAATYLEKDTGTEFYIAHNVQDKDIIFRVNDGGSNVNAIKIDASDTGSVKLPNDNQYLYIGAGNDCYFGHGGTNSVWGNNTGTLQIRNHTSDADMFLSVNDGGSHINAIQIDASDTGSVRLPSDDQWLYIGASGDLKMKHNSSGYSVIDNITGHLYITASDDDCDIILRSDDGSGSVTPYLTLDGSAGTVNIDKEIHLSTHLDMGDGDRIKLGDSDDLQIVHDSNINFIHSTISDRDIYFRVNDGGSSVDAIIIDASDAGTATFSHDIRLNTELGAIRFGATQQGSIYEHASDIIISNSAAGNDTVFENLSSDGSSYVKNLFIDGSTQRVGIGTSSPSFKLKVNVDNGTYTDMETIAAFQSKRGADTEYEAGIMINSMGDCLAGSISSNLYWTDNVMAKGNTGRSGGAFQIDNSASNESQFLWRGTPYNSTTLTNYMMLDNTQSLQVLGDVVAYSTSVSDKRLKDNVETIDDALEKVMKLRGVEFDWIGASRKGQHDIGLIAQEVEEVIPEIVREKEFKVGEFTDNKQTFKTVDYDKMVGVLIEAIKEQQIQIDELKTKIGE